MPYEYTDQQRMHAMRDFVHGRGSLRDVAAKHGLNVSTVCHWSSKEKWSALRIQHRKAMLAAIQAPARELERALKREPQLGKLNARAACEEQLAMVRRSFLLCKHPLLCKQWADLEDHLLQRLGSLEARLSPPESVAGLEPPEAPSLPPQRRALVLPEPSPVPEPEPSPDLPLS